MGVQNNFPEFKGEYIIIHDYSLLQVIIYELSFNIASQGLCIDAVQKPLRHLLELTLYLNVGLLNVTGETY